MQQHSNTMRSLSDREREVGRIRKIVDKKVDDYLGRQCLHNRFDERGGLGYTRPAVYSFQSDLTAGCRYHRSTSSNPRRVLNLGVPVSNKEFLYVVDKPALKRSKSTCNERFHRTADALIEKLPVVEACVFYNRQYFCKNSKYGHRVSFVVFKSF